MINATTNCCEVRSDPGSTESVNVSECGDILRDTKLT